MSARYTPPRRRIARNKCKATSQAMFVGADRGSALSWASQKGTEGQTLSIQKGRPFQSPYNLEPCPALSWASQKGRPAVCPYNSHCSL